MRRHLPFDIWLCLALSALVALAVGKGVKFIADSTYADYEEAHMVADGDIGGIAGEDVFRAQSIADMLEHDTFTVISHGIQYRNEGGGFYGNGYMDMLRLPSGERVAARINNESVQSQGNTIYDGDTILPVGCIVYEDLTQHPTFLDQIQFRDPLTRTDFYVDMMGDGAKLRQEDYSEVPVLLSQIITVVILFPLIHAFGARLGIFPYYFPPRKKEGK
ncbi:MAG: hypothetical protein HFH06_13205 [Lachnospiraceae bacterium]|nr:hypothetical protein [Lachnospiraceae bacterium]